MILALPPHLAGIDTPVFITATTSISVAFVGLIAKYFNDLTMQRRKDKLDRLNLQLKHLYGPLYAAVHASETSYASFRKLYRPNVPYFGGKTSPTEEDYRAWRLWMTEVFMPINLQMEQTIVKNADLLIGDVMPDCFLLLCAHTAAYKPVLKKWELQNYKDHLSVIAFPREELTRYVDESFLELKRQQGRLLGQMNLKPGHKVRSRYGHSGQAEGSYYSK